MKKSSKKKMVQIIGHFMVELLGAIKDAAQALPQPLESKGEYYQRIYRTTHDYPSQKIYRGIYNLKKQGLVKANTKKRYILELTLEGKQKLLINKISKSRVPRNDGYSTIVIFDIPEERARYRAFLRRLLLKNGFMNIQKSVLISRFDLPQEFFELLKELKIRQNVSVLKAQIQYK